MMKSFKRKRELLLITPKEEELEGDNNHRQSNDAAASSLLCLPRLLVTSKKEEELLSQSSDANASSLLCLPRLLLTPKKEEELGQSSDANAFSLLCLPWFLIIDILARLPILSIFYCKFVCKTFLTILKDPYFTDVYLKKAADISLLILRHPTILLASIVDLETTADNISFLSLEKVPRSLPNYKGGIIFPFPVGSCNGLLCLRYFDLTCRLVHLYVCNPVLGKFTMLPQPLPTFKHHCGFGFCPKTKQYKVIRFLNDSNLCEIFTLGTKHWRRVDAPCPATRQSFDSSFEGNLHWIVEGYSMINLICSFNLETEQYSYICPPSYFSTRLCHRMVFHFTGNLDGLFCIGYILNRTLFEVCVMEDYGVNESWVKKISINIIGSKWSFTNGYAFLDNGVLLVMVSISEMIYFNARTGKTRSVMVDRGYRAVFHTPSFISLKDIWRRKKVEKLK